MIIRTDIINKINISNEKIPVDDVMMKNQNETPAVTASDLNLMEEEFILNRINECDES